MIGYYLFVCMIYVIVIFLVYIGHCCFYSIDILILNYVRYNCLLRMIHVLWLAIHSRLCRGVYAVVLLTPLYMIINNVHDPDLILLVYMLSVAGRLATKK